MANLLRRLFSRPDNEIAPDVAQGDWTPPPPSEVGSTDWAHWLVEEPPRPQREAVATSKNPTGPMPLLNLPSTHLDQSDDIVGTWAELEDLEEAPVVGAPVPEVPEPVAASPSAIVVEEVVVASPTLPPRRRRDTLGGGRARIRTPMPERRWRDVLTEYAEHLTDEELAIIRKQMAK